jgi:putative restriction endonuclease
MPAVIVENDESEWNDETGEIYHFPKRYLPILTPGQKVIYYKGRLRDPNYATQRLSPEPHYFGIAEIGRVYADRESKKGDYFARILGYRPFTTSVSIRQTNGETFEQIPSTRISNYWRDGVRPISEAVYDAILSDAELLLSSDVLYNNNRDWPTRELQSVSEGSVQTVFTTVYERDPALRGQALSIHGYTCFGCGCNFEERYRVHGRGFIHIHHLKPLHSLGGPQSVNPKTDMIPVCPNCHCMIHRRKRHTLSLEELRKIVRPLKGSGDLSCSS